MPLDITGLTSPVPAAAPAVSIRFPGGIRMSGALPTVHPATKLENAAMALGRATSGLGPLSAVFAVIEAVIAIKDFAVAVPALIVDPEPVVEAIKDLVKAVSKLLSLIPALSLPILIYDVIVATICLLEGLVLELAVLAAQIEKIETVEAQAVTVPALAPIAAAARVDVATQMGNLQATLGEVGSIIGVVNAMGEPLGLPQIPVGTDMGSDPTAAVVVLTDLVNVLTAIRDAIPL